MQTQADNDGWLILLGHLQIVRANRLMRQIVKLLYADKGYDYAYACVRAWQREEENTEDGKKLGPQNTAHDRR